MKEINILVILTIVTLFVSCSQKQFAFRKTIKSKSKEQVSIVVPKNKKSEIISIQVVDAKKPDLEKVKKTQIETRIIKKSKNVLLQFNIIKDNQPTKSTLREKAHQNKLEIKKRLHGERNGYAVAGFVFGLLGWILLPFGFIFGLLAIVFSANGLKRAKAGAKGWKLAKAGLIIGIIDFLIGTAVIITFVIQPMFF